MVHLNFNPFPVITTARLVLRHMTMEDENEYFIIRADEDLNKYIDNPRPKNMDELRAVITRMNSYVTDNKGIVWTITEKGNNTMIGSICIWTMTGSDDAWELGYGMLAPYQGKGLMKEALLAAVNYGFDTMLLPIVHATTHKDNAASTRLLERSGFWRDTALEAEKADIAELENMVIYSLTK